MELGGDIKAIAYYGDGREVDATNGLTDKDSRGIQAIAQLNPYERVPVEIVTGTDYYFFDERTGLWGGGDIFALFCKLLDDPNIAMGNMMILTSEYNAIYDKIQKKKHGWLAREKRP